MSKKLNFGLLFLLGSMTFSQENMETTSFVDEVTIDLKDEKITAEGGVNFKFDNIRLKAYEIDRDTENNIVEARKDVIAQIKEENSDVKFETGSLKLDLNEKKFYFADGLGRLKVDTGAEASDDKIYFGGKSGEGTEEKVTVKDAWMTTTRKVLEVEDPKDSQYHIAASEIVVEPNEKASFYDNRLYIGDREILWLPWYSINLRPGSEVPLFPVFGSDEDYGFYTSWGLIYGKNSRFFKGGIAPKFADELGLLIGRFENRWQPTDKTWGQLNLTDTLVYKKDSDIDDRWDMDYTQVYESSGGDIEFSYRNVTANNWEQLEKLRDEKEDDGEYTESDPRPSGSENIQFYTLDSDVKGAGSGKDIDFYSSMYLVDEKDILQEVVDDELEDASYLSVSDHDLYTDLEFKKDNDDYAVSANYHYLDDLDAGSSPEDLQSKREDFGFGIELKDYKFSAKYSEENGDEYRGLRYWERDPNLKELLELDYVPWTVPLYDEAESKKSELKLGEYGFLGTELSLDYENKHEEKTLNTDDDSLRGFDTENERDSQYNRFEDLVYKNVDEESFGGTVSYDSLKLRVSTGRTEEEIWDREGIYSYTDFGAGDAYDVYENESDFVQFQVEEQDLPLWVLGSLGAGYTLRMDEYDEGDETERHEFYISHKKSFETGEDSSLANSFKYSESYNQYSLDDRDSVDVDADEAARLKNRDDYKQYTDTLEFEFGEKSAAYTFDYKERFDPFRDGKEGDVLGNQFRFDFGENHSLNLASNLDKTDKNDFENSKGEIYDIDLDSNAYSLEYEYGGNKVYYRGEEIDYGLIGKNADATDATDDVDENLLEAIYGYELSRGDDKWNFEYKVGESERYNLSSDVIDLDSKNNGYSVSYLDGGQVENFYKINYEVYDKLEADYLDGDKSYQEDLVSLRYEYRNKGETEEGETARVDLKSIREEAAELPDYKNFFAVSLLARRHKEYYDQSGDFFDSLKESEVRLEAGYNRLKLGYAFDQTADFEYGAGEWIKTETEREHELAMQTKIGDPSRSWKLKLFTRLDEDSAKDDDGKLFDEYGVELGKEREFYELSVAFKNEWDKTTEDYEWTVSFEFALLTFPNMPIFGAEKSYDASWRPLFMGSGVDIDSYVD